MKKFVASRAPLAYMGVVEPMNYNHDYPVQGKTSTFNKFKRMHWISGCFADISVHFLRVFMGFSMKNCLKAEKHDKTVQELPEVREEDREEDEDEAMSNAVPAVVLHGCVNTC